MGQFTPETAESISQICTENAGAIAECLGGCLERQFTVEVGPTGAWQPEALPAEFSGPGLVVLLQVGEEALACLIPDSLPLPEWYIQPNDSERARLDTLSMEWSLNLLPPDLEAERFATLTTRQLGITAQRMQPAEWAQTLDLIIGEPSATEVKTVLKLVWPLQAPLFDVPEDLAIQPLAEEPPADAPPANQPAAPPADPLARLRGLPVVVSVRLAEKRIPLGQLLAVVPGSLIAFSKSCDDPLELYVNNSLYCRGEAVKIGENFGLKINEVGVHVEQHSRVINN